MAIGAFDRASDGGYKHSDQQGRPKGAGVKNTRFTSRGWQKECRAVAASSHFRRSRACMGEGWGREAYHSFQYTALYPWAVSKFVLDFVVPVSTEGAAFAHCVASDVRLLAIAFSFETFSGVLAKLCSSK